MLDVSGIVGKPWWLAPRSILFAEFNPPPPPELLTTKKRLRRPPPGFADCVSCRECGADLIHSLNGFICSSCMASPLIPPAALLDRVRERFESLPPEKLKNRSTPELVFRRIVLLIEWRHRRPDLK